ncbi:AzlC family ABC transporter permease [Williamsia soli]|uniref:AzlC family ABC transporter permease n=1 Tax=Williamsia soli TaxID=364929 RepID=UPI001A9FA8A8|nr:AzlC family ABC transporter permease [Williamsia soli]
MRSIWRTLDPQLTRDIALVCAAISVVGLSFGAIAVSSGLPLWVPLVMSIVVFAGASQFAFVAIVAAGGGIVAAVSAGLLANARHILFGFSLGDVFGTSLASRLVGSHLMVDESVAFTLSQTSSHERRSVYWLCGGGLFVSWNLGVLVGALGGTLVSDTDAFGLDAAFPAVLLALILPSLAERATRRAAVVGAVIAVAVSPLLPAGVPILLALSALVLTMPLRRPKPAIHS